MTVGQFLEYLMNEFQEVGLTTVAGDLREVHGLMILGRLDDARKYINTIIEHDGDYAPIWNALKKMPEKHS